MKANMRRVSAAFDDMIESNGVDAQVTLSSGETGTLRVSDVGRVGDPLTAGITQEQDVVRCMAERWHGKFPRPPAKGDSLTILGRRYGVIETRPARFGSTVVGYTLRVKG